jgi:Tfp pilus assembly protein PilF
MSRRMRRAAEHRLRRVGRAALPALAALMLMAAATPAPHSGNAESQHYYADAREQLDRGDARAALIQLKNALRADSANIEARYVLGTLYLSAGQADLAEHELKQARQDGMPADQIMIPLAQSYLDQAKYDALLKEFPAGGHQGAFEAEILNLRGAAFGAMQRYDDAEKSFRAALQANPKGPKPFLGLARIALARKDFGAAQGFAEQAIGIEANYADAHAVRAEAARLGGNMSLATEEYDKALSINGFNRVALLGRAAMRIDAGALDTGESDIKAVLGQSPHNVMATYLKALLAAKRQDAKTALAVLQGEPNTILMIPAALFLQSALLIEQNQTAQGEQGLERYLQQAPADDRARKLLAQSYLKHQDADKAMLILTPALDNDPHDQDLVKLIVATHQMQYAKGDAAAALEAAQKGDRAAARAALQKAIAARPDFIAGQVALGDLYLADGKMDDAKVPYDRVLANHPTEIGAMMGEAKVWLRRQDQRQATNWLQRAHEAHPKAEEPVLMLVDLALSAKDTAKATALAKDLVAADAKSVRGRQALGHALAAAGDQKGAVAAFQEGLAMQPEDLGMRADLIRYQLATNQPEEALKSADAMPADVADRGLAEVLRGDAEFATGHFDQAEAAYAAAYKASPSAPVADRLYAARSKAKMPDALAPLVSWVQEHPDDQPARSRLALRYLQSNDIPGATKAYEAILTGNPSDLEATNNLAWLYQRSHDNRARAMAERAYKLAPDNPDVIDTYGWVLIQTGDAKNGLPMVQKATAAQPGRATYRYHEAVGLAAQGKSADAKKLLEPLLSSGAAFDEDADARALLQKIGGKK